MIVPVRIHEKQRKNLFVTTRKNKSVCSNKFGISLGLHYLCRPNKKRLWQRRDNPEIQAHGGLR